MLRIPELSPFMNIIRTMREERGTASRGKHYAVVDADSCGSWVDWYGEVICGVEKLVHLAGPETLDPAESSSFS